MTTLALFPSCPLPGCRNPVADPREPCGECAAAFGSMLRVADGPVPSADEFTAASAAASFRAAVVMAERALMTVANQEPERKRNQACWACEQRRTCRPDPDYPARWICQECESTEDAR